MIKKRGFLFGFLFVLIWLLSALSVAAQGEAGDLLGRINNLRASVGLPGYTTNGALAAAAQSQAQWIVDNGVVSHSRPDGSTPRTRAAAAGYGSLEVSENIYGGTNASVGAAWAFWINSSIHYAGLTNARYKEIGIGIARGGWGTAYVLVFGNPGGDAYVPPRVSSGSGGGARQQPSYVVGLDSHGNIMHEIQPGDTLGDIALIYGYTWGDIPTMVALNGMTEADYRELEVGAVLLIPPHDGTYTPTPGAETDTPTPTPTSTPDAPPTAEPENTPEPLSTSRAVSTSDTLPQAVAMLFPSDTPTPTPSLTPEPDETPEGTKIAAAVTSDQAGLSATDGGTTITRAGTSPWLVIALVVQVGVLLVAGFEFLRRMRRR